MKETAVEITKMGMKHSFILVNVYFYCEDVEKKWEVEVVWRIE